MFCGVLVGYFMLFFFFCRETRYVSRWQGAFASTDILRSLSRSGLTVEESAVIYETDSARDAAYHAELTLRARAREAANGASDGSKPGSKLDDTHLENTKDV